MNPAEVELPARDHAEKSRENDRSRDLLGCASPVLVSVL
jgi:hypothetical protein